MKITGHDVIEALRAGTIERANKYADPTEDDRDDLTLDEAEDIARVDPSLLWAEVPGVECQCGRVTGVACDWSGPEAKTVLVEYMPRHLRASHDAAGNRGRWPHNGAMRMRMEWSCAALVVETEDGWAHIVEEG